MQVPSVRFTRRIFFCQDMVSLSCSDLCRGGVVGALRPGAHALVAGGIRIHIGDRLSRAGAGAGRIAATQIAFDHLARAVVIVDGAEGAGDGADLATYTETLVDLLGTGSGIDLDRLGGTGIATPGLVALGTGIGSMIPVMIGTAYLSIAYTHTAIAVLWFYGLASILVHSSSGFVLGMYIREGRYWYGIGIAALIILPFNFMALWWYLFIFEASRSISWEIVVIMILYAIALGYHHLRDLQRGLNPEMRRKWQRERRKWGKMQEKRKK